MSTSVQLDLDPVGIAVRDFPGRKFINVGKSKKAGILDPGVKYGFYARVIDGRRYTITLYKDDVACWDWGNGIYATLRRVE